MKRISSETIISRAGALSKTGTPHGEHGLATQDDLRIVNWLASRTPYQVEKALVSRASSRSVALDVIYEHRFPRDERGNPLPVQSVCKAVKFSGSDEDVDAVRQDFIKAMQPAPEEMIEGWLAELSVISAKRTDDEFSETLRIGAYVARLRRYPADVVYDVLFRKTHRFFPTWAELEADLEVMTMPRRMTIEALGRRTHEAEPDAPRCSREAAEKIMREVFGD